MRKARGSIWKNKSNRAGFVKSQGSYKYIADHDRMFCLTALKSKRTKVYESPAAAVRDGWYIISHGK